MNIYEKLLRVKQQVPYLKTDGSGFNYKYVTPENVLGTINPLLIEEGIIIIPAVLAVTLHPTEKLNSKGVKITEFMFVVQMEYQIINAEEPEDRIIIGWAGAGQNDEEKGFGSALSYAERYMFMKLFQIASGAEDPDAKNRDKPAGNVKSPVAAKKLSAREAGLLVLFQEITTAVSINPYMKRAWEIDLKAAGGKFAMLTDEQAKALHDKYTAEGAK